MTLGKAVLVENIVDTKTWGQNVLGTFHSRGKTSIVPVGTELVLSLLETVTLASSACFQSPQS